MTTINIYETRRKRSWTLDQKMAILDDLVESDLTVRQWIQKHGLYEGMKTGWIKTLVRRKAVTLQEACVRWNYNPHAEVTNSIVNITSLAEQVKKIRSREGLIQIEEAVKEALKRIQAMQELSKLPPDVLRDIVKELSH